MTRSQQNQVVTCRMRTLSLLRTRAAPRASRAAAAAAVQSPSASSGPFCPAAAAHAWPSSPPACSRCVQAAPGKKSFHGLVVCRVSSSSSRGLLMHLLLLE